MTSINASAVNPYPQSQAKTRSAGAEDSQDTGPLAPVKESQEADGKELRVDSPNASIDAVTGSGDAVKQLQKQIEQTQKILAEQQAQLVSTEKGQQASDQQKAQQMMEIQAQIAVTNSTLQVLQAALVQAMFSVDVHA